LEVSSQHLTQTTTIVPALGFKARVRDPGDNDVSFASK
jgi:hypothetical protein